MKLNYKQAMWLAAIIIGGFVVMMTVTGGFLGFVIAVAITLYAVKAVR